MVLWGGLRPIISRVILDKITLASLTYATLTQIDENPWNVACLSIAVALTAVSAGLTKRWTLSLPMVPLVLLQLMRRLEVLHDHSWVQITITVASLLLILAGTALCILFPAVEIHPISGPYNVGMIDFYLPIRELSTIDGSESITELPVRLLYPTEAKPEWIPYLSKDTAEEFCLHSMKFGAPPPLKNFGWMLHNWMLVGLEAKRNAKVLPVTEDPSRKRFPLVVFSHGLSGNAQVYAYQTFSLAANGNIVLVLNHQDGSAPVVKTASGSLLTYDYEVAKLDMKDEVAYVKARRARTEFRAREMLAAVEAMHQLDRKCDRAPVLEQFRNRIDVKNTVFMGHSFGGATALTAARRRPDLVRCVVAHDPAIDWSSDDIRRSLLSTERLKGLRNPYYGGTGGLSHGKEDRIGDSLHDLDLLFLYSQEWMERNFGSCVIFEELFQTGRFGAAGGISKFAVIDQTRHNEFSDTSMLTPAWLARAVGITGKRNPHSTAREIHLRTLSFLEEMKSNPKPQRS